MIHKHIKIGEALIFVPQLLRYGLRQIQLPMLALLHPSSWWLQWKTGSSVTWALSLILETQARELGSYHVSAIFLSALQILNYLLLETNLCSSIINFWIWQTEAHRNNLLQVRQLLHGKAWIQTKVLWLRSSALNHYPLLCIASEYHVDYKNPILSSIHENGWLGRCHFIEMTEESQNIFKVWETCWVTNYFLYLSKLAGRILTCVRDKDRDWNLQSLCCSQFQLNLFWQIRKT